jgi:hypothetical protein
VHCRPGLGENKIRKSVKSQIQTVNLLPTVNAIYDSVTPVEGSDTGIPGKSQIPVLISVWTLWRIPDRTLTLAGIYARQRISDCQCRYI